MSELTSKTTDRATDSRLRRCFLATLLVLATGMSLSAQVSRYPDPRNWRARAGDPAAGDFSPLSGIGAGAERSGSSHSPLRPLDDADSARSRGDGRLRPGHRGWESWWHLRFYRILRSRARSGSPPDGDSNPAEVLRRDAADLIRSRLESGDPLERQAAAMALARLAPGECLAELVFTLEEAEIQVQESIVLALGIIGGEEARPYLRGLSRDLRSGRRALGRAKEPVPESLRAIATLSLGFLPGRRDDDTLDLIAARPRDYPESQQLALGLAVGLRFESRLRSLAAETAMDAIRPDLAPWLATARNPEIPVAARASLVMGLAHALPAGHEIIPIATELLDHPDSGIARSAAASLGELTLAGQTEAKAALWRRAGNAGDATAAGQALLALARNADDDATFEKLLATGRTFRTLRSYGAFALVEAAAGNPDRRRFAAAEIRDWLAQDRTESPTLGAACLALGLLADCGSDALLVTVANDHGAARVRSAATLGLGLLGQPPSQSIADRPARTWQESVTIHDAAIAQAMGRGAAAENGLLDALRRHRDDYSLGGVARALGLVGTPRTASELMEIIGDDEELSAVRAFAIGAIGLIFERSSGSDMARLRAVSPVPIDSEALMRVLSHL